jgi:hypothetical protein
VSFDLRYERRSSVYRTHAGTMVELMPNLARERVAFAGEIGDPLRFREAMSALHEVVVGDFRVPKKDRSAHRAHRERLEREDDELRRAVLRKSEREELAKVARRGPLPKDLNQRFRQAHRKYWGARRRFSAELLRSDPALWRHLVPCDPIVTVAPDVVLFEGFAKDESSYGCVSVDRDGFRGSQEAELGTTNVDYSQALYDHFQTLRTYRTTRLSVDPHVFEVASDEASLREEQIDLPPSWLRGFGQISAATSLPSQSVVLSVAAVYSLLAFLRRKRERQGPRSLRFELSPGAPIAIVIEPWETRIVDHARGHWSGEPRVVKIWGRRRLMALSRVLAHADRVEVRLLGSGLPSLWIAHLGPMRFTLALSGWTTNDFSSGAALDLLAGHQSADTSVIASADAFLSRERAASLASLREQLHVSDQQILAAMHALAKRGQVIYDFAHDRFRYRQILSEALGESLVGPEPPELVEGRNIYLSGAVRLEREERIDRGRRLAVARVGGHDCEAIFDADGVFEKASCPCSHHHRFGLRQGPCRHLLALRFELEGLGPRN